MIQSFFIMLAVIFISISAVSIMNIRDNRKILKILEGEKV